jgi:hypothetical protein
MSRRMMTWALWLVFAATLPLPYYMIDRGRVPAVQLFLLAAVTTPLVFSDPSFTTRFVAALFVVQSLIYGVLIYVLARIGARLIERHAARRWHAIVLVGVAVLLVAAGLFEIYRAPLSHGPGPTNLVGVFR